MNRGWNEYEIEKDLEDCEKERQRAEYGSVFEYVYKSEDIFIEKLWDTIRYPVIALAIYFAIQWKFPGIAMAAMLSVALSRPFVRYFSKWMVITTVFDGDSGELKDRFFSGTRAYIGVIIGFVISLLLLGMQPLESKLFPVYAIAPFVLQCGVVTFIMAVPLVNNIHDVIACRRIMALKQTESLDAALAYADDSFDKRKKINRRLIVIWFIAMIVVAIGQYAFSFVCSFHADASFDAWKAWQTIEEPEYELTEEQVQNPVKIQMNAFKGKCEVAYSFEYYDGIYHSNAAMIVEYQYSPRRGWFEVRHDSSEEIVSMETAGTWTGELVRQEIVGSTGFDTTLRVDRLTYEEAKGSLALVNKKTGENFEASFTATVTKNEYGILIIKVDCESPLDMELTLHYNLKSNGIESQHTYKGMLTKQEK